MVFEKADGRTCSKSEAEVCSTAPLCLLRRCSRVRDSDLVRRVDPGLSIQQQPYGLGVASVRRPAQGRVASLPASAHSLGLDAVHPFWVQT